MTYQELGLGGKEIDVDQTTLNSIGGGGTHEEGTQELTDGGDHDSLLQVQGTRADGGTKRVRDIVGTDTIGIQKRKDHAER